MPAGRRHPVPAGRENQTTDTNVDQVNRDMTLYLSLGNTIGTVGAVRLARRLAAWHDAMVMHQRRARDTSESCDSHDLHDDARSLWREALDMYGEHAHQLVFLRTHGMRSGPTCLDSPMTVEAQL